MQKRRSGAPARARVLGAVCALTLTVAGCGPSGEPTPTESTPTGTQDKPVVYGADDRQDVYAHPDAQLRTLAQQAGVTLVYTGDMDESDPNNISFPVPTLQDWEGLCPTERFLQQLVPGFCSGTLIDDDLVLTAGHCITNTVNDPDVYGCNETKFVFKHYNTAENTLSTITSADVFSCKTVVVRRQDDAPDANGLQLDYAIVRLDRAAAPRFTPAPVRPGNTALAVGDKVAVIGSPDGMPLKIDAGGAVRDAGGPTTTGYFVANTDTFGGNSGSGVYDLNSYSLAGILVRGDEDYVNSDPNDPNSCYVVNVCPDDGCAGEESTYVRPAINALCAATTSARLCPVTQPASGTFTFSASATNSATTGTVNKKVTLTAGQTLTVGTCGMTGASFTGDTYLRVAGTTGAEVASNDDSCGGRGSKVVLTAFADGDYEIRAGCYGATSCGGTVAWSIGASANNGGTLQFSATNTNSAQQNTVNKDLALTAGQTLTVGTCGVAGASGTGDTYLRLYNSTTGNQVALNDDGCGGQTSKIAYTVPAGGAGTYQVRVGCYGATSCSGTLAWTIQ